MLVGLLTARRFGKTEGFLRLCGALCQQKPKTRCCMLYQHRTDSVDIAWPLLEDLREDYSWDAELYTVELACKFANGSIIKLYGADDPRKHRRFKGMRADLFAIDEAQDFHSDIERLVRWVVPGLAERQGRMFVMGTPGEHDEGFWYDLMVAGEHPAWTRVYGDPLENPHTKDALLRQYGKWEAGDPDVRTRSWFLREYGGKWVTDSTRAVCRVNPVLNHLTEWPHGYDERGRIVVDQHDSFVLSVRFSDEHTTFVLGCYNPKSHANVIFLSAERIETTDIKEVAALLDGYRQRHPRLYMFAVPDAEGKSLAGKLADEYGQPIETADRDDLAAQTKMMKTDLKHGFVKLYNADDPSRPEAHPLQRQWEKLIKVRNKRTGDFEEQVSAEVGREMHDAALYLRSYAYKHLYEAPAPPRPKFGSREYWEAEEAAMEAEIAADARGDATPFRPRLIT